MRGRAFELAWLVVLLTLLAACGGSGDSGSTGEANEGEGTPFEGIGEAATGVELLEAGAVTVTADPGQGWVEVEGQRLEFSAASGDPYECLITDENLSIIYRTVEGAELRLSGLLLPEGWNLSLTILAPDLDDYRVSLRSGTFGVDGDSLSYEGTVEKVENGVTVAQEEVRMAANCASA